MKDAAHIGNEINVGDYQDRELIKDLYARFYQATADHEAEAWAGCFLDDGWIETKATGLVKGRDALQAMLERNQKWVEANGLIGLRHHVSNLRITIDGDRARGQCCVTVWSIARDHTVTLFTLGGYHDTLLKRDRCWYFETRSAWTDGHVPVMNSGRGASAQ
jgi:hypothetical protein